MTKRRWNLVSFMLIYTVLAVVLCLAFYESNRHSAEAAATVTDAPVPCDLCLEGDAHARVCDSCAGLARDGLRNPDDN